MPALPDRAACSQAVAARDPRFDGVFFVGIATTGIYCRPVCPSRVARDENRRFYATAARAEAAGFRPCLRCRPEMAPGHAGCDAVASLAATAAGRIAAGALNEGSLSDLAASLGVTERHLRRALRREAGVSPVALAQTHRLLLAKQLLADTRLSVTEVAYASGFQSLRRFHAVWQERYGLSPTALRRGTGPTVSSSGSGSPRDTVRLALAYRAPLAWHALLAEVQRDALPGVETVGGGRYARTVRLGGHEGVVSVALSARARRTGPSLDVDVSLSLLPVLMPLLARLRRLFDLDAEPAVIDAALARGGFAKHIHRCPGLRLPGAADGFEAALGIVLADVPGARVSVVAALGDPAGSDGAGLSRHAPTPTRVAEAGAGGLASLGVPEPEASALAALASAVSRGDLCLEPGLHADASRSVLAGLLPDRIAARIAARALAAPDAFPSATVTLDDACRPWRAYAALHLGLFETPA